MDTTLKSNTPKPGEALLSEDASLIVGCVGIFGWWKLYKVCIEPDDGIEMRSFVSPRPSVLSFKGGLTKMQMLFQYE